MTHSTDPPISSATGEQDGDRSAAATRLTPREARIAEETVSAIDFFSRLLGAIESGNWHYALDKLGQLQRPLLALGEQLVRRDKRAAGPPVEAAVRREAQHYRIGKALYGERQAATEPSPLAQAEAAKRERDLVGELGALQAGYEALTSAPWYPAQAGDIVHVFYWGSFADAMPAQGEMYVVERAPVDVGGLSLKLLHADEHLASPGAFEGGWTDDPLMEAWMEAGPAALTIVRNGRVIHGDGAR